MESKKFSLQNAIKAGFSLMLNHLRVLVPVFFIMMGIMAFKTFLIFGLYDWSLIQKLYKARKIGLTLQPMVVVVRPHIWFIIISFLFLYALYLFFYLGAIKIVFNLYDTGESRKRVLFSSLPLMPKALMTALLVYLLPFMVGFILGIPFYIFDYHLPDQLLPPLLFLVDIFIYIYLTAVILWQYILVDQNIGGIQAMRYSYYLLKGNILKLTGIYILVRILTKMLPFFDIITWPIIFLVEICILVVIYRQATQNNDAITYIAPEYL